MSNSGKQISIVTGAAGFIGSHLTDYLINSGSLVIGIDDLSFGSLSNLPTECDSFKFIKADINDRTAIDNCISEYQPSVVFHLAANASVPLSEKEPRFDFEVNAAGTVNILDTLRRLSPTTKLVLASSAAVYGEPLNTITEATSIQPISHYGLSKYVAELECQRYCKSYGIPVVIARLFNCYGPRMPRFVVLDFLKKLQKDPTKLEILGSGKQTRDFTFVSDTVRGIVLSSQTGQIGQAYNIASGHSSSVSELAQLLLEQLSLKESAKIQYTGESWPGDAQNWSVNISKAESIGYIPEVDLSNGLAQVIKWFNSKS